MSQSSVNKAKIAVLGMGAMGSRMATRLIEAGHQVTVWNRTRDKTEPLVELGAMTAGSPLKAVQQADVVICMVRDDEASQDAWLHPEFGALAGMKAGAIAIESSTLSLNWIANLERHCRTAGIAFLDAPVVGTRPHADSGQLVYVVGGETQTIDNARDVLQTMGNAIHHIGAVGTGTAVKLAINTLFSVQVATLAELLSILEKVGVQTDKATHVIASTPVCSPAAKLTAESIVARNFAPLFPVELVEKDLGYAVQMGKTANAFTPIANNALTIFGQAMQKGLATSNITGIANIY